VLVVLGVLIGFTLGAYLVVLYQHNLEPFKWILFEVVFNTIGAVVAFRFILQVMKDNNEGIIHHSPIASMNKVR